MLLLPSLHKRDLLVLCSDDVTGQLQHFRVLAILDLHLEHIHGSHMVWLHSGHEILIGVAGHELVHFLYHLLPARFT